MKHVGWVCCSVFLVIVLLGCTGQGPITVAKNDPSVQSFLKDYPGAKEQSMMVSASMIQKAYPTLVQECGSQIPLKDSYRVTFADPPSKTLMTVFIGKESKQVYCIFIKTMGQADTSSTCAQQNGHACNTLQKCDGETIPASDTNACCLGSCTQLTGNSSLGEPSQILIDYEGTELTAFVYRPDSKNVDVILAYHGTVDSDSQIITFAKNMGDIVKNAITKENIMIISVAYPQHSMLFGDNFKESEAALLWTKSNAETELGVTINRIFLVGHSQGGYMVTRLNTLYETDGVIANGVGPIDLSFRCALDEKDPKTTEGYCVALKEAYGSAVTNPDPYIQRSLISFTSGYKSKILFTQGMKDGKVQMALWPGFKEKINACTDCAPITIREIPNGGHGAAFTDAETMQLMNDFIS
ncbi:MAG TPA: hypothetical protein VJH97_02660 [Candidatus Nanoarchaeia archaeon]|nr:hypothetical protein [Candidatus Nanoarchaeia archaeon]